MIRSARRGLCVLPAIMARWATPRAPHTTMRMCCPGVRNRCALYPVCLVILCQTAPTRSLISQQHRQMSNALPRIMEQRRRRCVRRTKTRTPSQDVVRSVKTAQIVLRCSAVRSTVLTTQKASHVSTGRRLGKLAAARVSVMMGTTVRIVTCPTCARAAVVRQPPRLQVLV